MAEYQYLVNMRGITKNFGSIEALRGIDLKIGENEIIGLLGDNGAGKSTLIKILTGVYTPTQGEIFWKDKKLSHYTVAQARDLGIETVFQDRALCEQQSIMRNIFMGREITKALGFLDIKKMRQETISLMKSTMGYTSSEFDPDHVVGSMAGGERLGVAVARALYFNSHLLILDEPTANLALAETQKVIRFVKKIKNEGKAAIFISHNVYHVYPVVDKFVLLDRGKVAFSYKKEEITLEELVKHMYEVSGYEIQED